MEGELLMTVLPYKGVSIFNEDGTYRKEDDVVQGRSYSSNLTKLLKQLPKLQNMQEGKPASPVMAHMSITNYCNLTCSPSSRLGACTLGCGSGRIQRAHPI